MRLLCVEDEAPLREDIAEFLRMKSYEVDEAGSGEEAIAQMNRQHYDLVLCDIKMPQMDGYEVLQQVRGENLLTTTPFIFLTALNERDDKMRAHEGGCDGYLTKPIDFSVLDATLKSHIQRQRARDFLFQSSVDALRTQVLAALDDTLNGPIGEVSLRSQHLLDTLPTLTPATLADQVREMQAMVTISTVRLHALYTALQAARAKQNSHAELVPLAELLAEASALSRHYYGIQKILEQSDLPEYSLHIDRTGFAFALASLISALPTGVALAQAIHFAQEEGYWRLSVCDHPAMADDTDFLVVDDTTNLAVLTPVTRQRLLPLMLARQVAHAHDGRIELAIWPENHLAVRFVIPSLSV